ncbi:MAG: bleomycin hydrolase [Bacteroidia bacterium]|jgi:bleomycin hydrolase
MRISYIIPLVLLSAMAFSQAPKFPAGFETINMCQSTSVKSQDRTGTCWSFSTSSFLESEVLKKGGKAIDLSEMYTVRMIYMEKAIKYVRYHGISNFSEGSLAHDVIIAYTKYGMMPESAYSGKNGAEKHNHSVMVKELKSYLDTLLKSRPIEPHWKAGFNLILDNHLGEVKPVFEYEGMSYNPQSFAQQVLKLNMKDYLGFTSFTHQPFYRDYIVEVPDNFSNGEYNNVPLNELMKTMDVALEKGYTIEWDGDVSERGFMRRGGYAFNTNDTNKLKLAPNVPSENEANQGVRQAGFDNLTTTDDHLMHVVGKVKYTDGRIFYVVKNSWSTRAGFGGYYLMSAAYMKMKTVSIVVNKKSVSKKLLKKLDD